MQVSDFFSRQFDAVIDAPFGAVGVAIRQGQLSTELLFGKYPPQSATHPLVKDIAQQVNTYFNNATHVFNLPIMLNGTPYQQSVWHAIRKIPAGKVMTYQAIADQLGSGARAVANACGANHLPLLVPCHRVVAKKGLGGFMCGHPDGQQIKIALLQYEGVKF
jgi:methylated-DNA-[protein]-cysteine S-methyltransferase